MVKKEDQKMLKGIALYIDDFDPFNNRHLQEISEIATNEDFTRVDIIPTFKLKYKNGLDYETRFKMCSLGIFGQYLYNVVVRHIPEQHLYKIIKQYRIESSLPLILYVGKDFNITTFKNSDYIKNNCIIVRDQRKPCLNISSTMIRNNIKNEKPINGFVPEAVLNFIKENGLYV